MLALFLAAPLWASLPARTVQAQVTLEFFPNPAAFFFANGVLVTMYVQVNTTSPIQAYDVDVTYDPTILKALVVSGLDLFDGDDALVRPAEVDNLSGEVRGIVDSNLGPPVGPGQLYVASVVFRVLKPGSLMLGFNAFTPTRGFADAAGNALSGQAVQTAVTIHSLADMDLDGLSSQYEQIITQTNPMLRDSDGDGTSDGMEDNDGDGVTNAAEYTKGTFANTQDTDADGFLDGADNCPHTYNPSQADIDADNRGNACDPDNDNDLLDDVDEPALGLDPSDPDTDDDGFPDGVEIARGTDPLDPDSFPLDAPAMGPLGSALLVILLAALASRRIRQSSRPS